MAQATLGKVLWFLRQACDGEAAGDLSDGALLERFLARREESAFALLVQRHGPLVLGVCRRVLGDLHGAEDCFQATFLVLVRRAASIRNKASLAGWLHAVAQRIAVKARTQAAVRRQRERRSANMPRPSALDELSWREIRAVLDEELGRLPDKYRDAIVLCHLQGKSHHQAAQELGWPRSSLASRLARARDLLRRQLARRGLVLATGALAVLLDDNCAQAAVSARLTLNTVTMAASIAAGTAAPSGLLSTRVAALAAQAASRRLGLKAKLALMLLVLSVALGSALLAAPGDPAPALARTAEPQPPASGKVRRETRDLFGDPLPDEAIARLGTVRFRHWGITSLTFSPRDNVLATTGADVGALCLWDGGSGRLLHQLGAPVAAFAAAFSPDGKTVVLNNLAVFDVATGKELRRLEAPVADFYFAIAFAPDGKTIAGGLAGNAATAIVLWDADTGKEIRRLEGHAESVWSLSFSSDSKRLASASSDRTVRLWDVATGKEILQLKGNYQRFPRVAFAPSDKVLAAHGDGGSVRLWQADTGKLLHELKGEGGQVLLPTLLLPTFAFSPDGKWLATGEEGGIVRIWDVDTAKELRHWQANVQRVVAVTFSPDGKVLASAESSSAIRLWDPATGKALSPAYGHTSPVYSVRYAADGKTLYSAAYDWNVIEWDLTTCRPRRQLASGSLGTDLTKWSNVVQALSPDGKLLAWIGLERGHGKSDHVIHLWDVDKAKEIGTLDGHTAPILHPPQFSPDQKLLASVAEDGIRLWDLATAKELHHHPNGPGPRDGIVMSPDGKLLAFVAPDQKLRLWDIAARKELRQWPTEQRYNSLVFSADSRQIASFDLKDIRLWDVATGKPTQHLTLTAPEMVASAAISRGGRVLAASIRTRLANADSTARIRLWELFSGNEIRSLSAPDFMSMALDFAPDDRALAAGSVQSAITLRDLTWSAQRGSPGPLTAAALHDLWSDLAADAAKADRAIWTLTLAPEQSVPFLDKRLQPVTAAEPDKVAKLVADLDSDSFPLRSKAAKNLDDLGEGAEAAVRKLMEGKLTLEVRKRLEQFLDKQNTTALRKLRAIDALEHVGTPEARRIVEMVAKSAPNPRVAQAAAAALQRLAKRPV
jgi:RNA polymerase sigma factor (sigma-70 family)